MNIEEIVAQLGEATDAELSEALGVIGAQAREVGPENTIENVDKLEKLRVAQQAVLAEQAKRQELSARAEAARGAFTEDAGANGTEDADKVEKTEADEDKATGDGADNGTASTDGDGTGDGVEEGGDAVTASAKLGAITKARGADNAPAKTAGVVQARTVSVGSTPSFAAGTQLTRDDLAKALSERWAAIRNVGGNGKEYVARVNFEYPEERRLETGEAAFSTNRERIKGATSRDAITAAGGFCAPLENLYDINVIGITDRPVRDALTRFGVARGGIQYRPPMDALAMTDGLGVWTATDDAAVSNPPDGTPEKTCAVIECPALEDAVVDAIYLCLQFPNFTARFDPEWVDANEEAALIAHARFAENRLLSKLLTGSKLLTAPKVVSATRDILVTIDKTVAYYRNRHRLDTMVPLRMILPRWVLDLIRADLARGMGSAYDREMLGIADAAIRTFFTNRGVNVTFHLDGLGVQDPVDDPDVPDADDIPAQFYANAAAGTVVPGFIDKIDSVLYAEGDWLFLDGGTLDLGVVRDSSLNKINRYQTFVESWEGAAFNGIESLRLAMEVQPTGMVGGTMDLSALVD